MSDEEKEQMPLAGFEAGDSETFDLAKAREEMGLGGPHMKAEDLVDETFLITGAKQFKSSFKGQDRSPFFCRCFNQEDDEAFTTVLGGTQPTEILEAYIAAGGNRPLRVTLRFVKQGGYEGYYVIE